MERLPIVGVGDEAADAAALIVFAASASLDGMPLPWAAYDTGQAAAPFTVQAHASGLYTHQMGGFHRDQIGEAFGFGDDLAADDAKMAADPVTQRWWALTGPCQRPFDALGPEPAWQIMTEAWHLD